MEFQPFKNLIASDIKVINVNCPHCQGEHVDINYWAIKPHKTHLCHYCGNLFEVDVKSVSRPHITSEFYKHIEVK